MGDCLMNWRFEAFEGYRWYLESEEEGYLATIYGKFTSRGEAYFETSLDILSEDKVFKTLEEAIQYHE